MSVIINVLIAFHVLVCLLMVVVVLMQRPKNEGLGAAFGGGMTENIFGAQTTHVLQKFTVWLGIVFFALTLLLAILYAKRGTGETVIQKELLNQPAPAAAAAATAPSPAGTDTPDPADTSSAITATTTNAVDAAPVIATEPVATSTTELSTPAEAVPAEAAPSPAGN